MQMLAHAIWIETDAPEFCIDGGVSHTVESILLVYFRNLVGIVCNNMKLSIHQ
jgi:hypothetical protein